MADSGAVRAVVSGWRQADVVTVREWLASHGFTVNGVAGERHDDRFQRHGRHGTRGVPYRDPQSRCEWRGAFREYERSADSRGPGAGGRRRGLAAQFPSAAVAGAARRIYTFTNSQRHIPRAGARRYRNDLQPGSAVLGGAVTGQGQTIMVVEDTYLYSAGRLGDIPQHVGAQFGFTSRQPVAGQPAGRFQLREPRISGKSHRSRIW